MCNPNLKPNTTTKTKASSSSKGGKGKASTKGKTKSSTKSSTLLAATKTSTKSTKSTKSKTTSGKSSSKSKSTSTNYTDTNGDMHIKSVTFDSINNEFVVEAYSSSACPVFSKGMMTRWVEKHKVLFSVILIVIGIAEAFWGLRFRKYTIALIVFLVVFAFLLIIVQYTFVKPTT